MPDIPEIGFGTSGLRGRAEGFQPEIVAAYVAAFLETACTGAASKRVLIGADLRASSPAIAAMVADAVSANGWEPLDGGAVPTPALAHFALRRTMPAIMVTGSHIPPAYNGLKFYRPDGELRKSDENAIRAVASRYNPPQARLRTPSSTSKAVEDEYKQRYAAGFDLSGLRIGLFQHSAVGRDLLAEILTASGAQCHPFARSETFIAIDTEAVDEDHFLLMKQELRGHSFDAIVSTDGDGDRPFVLDETSTQINGDVLGALTARFLGASTIVTPLNATSALEKSGWFTKVLRTRIGSPYVVEAMAAEDSVIGFEANGGVLLGSDFTLASSTLGSLPTRDATLPILAVLAAAKQCAITLSALAANLPSRVMKSSRIKEITPERGNAFVAEMARSPAFRTAFYAPFKEPLSIDTRDGTRLSFPDGSIVHFRQSGNAPELRCYVETDTSPTTDRLLQAMMQCLIVHFEQGDSAS